jgi:hypothetical protein
MSFFFSNFKDISKFYHLNILFLYRMVMTRARHRKELKCDILKVKRHLGELSDRDFNKMVESPTQALVDYSPEAPETSDSGNEEWSPHSEITKRRPTRKRKTQPKKDAAKKPKPAERNPTRQAKKSRKQATKTSKIVSSF